MTNNINKKEIQPPYMDNGHYIYASFLPEDSTAVFLDIKSFQNQGYNVFYDEKSFEINYEKIKNCDVFVVFLTPNSSKSNRITEEINFALNNNKHVLPIYLVEFNLDLELDFALTGISSISKFKMNAQEYISKYVESFKNFGLVAKDSKDNMIKSKLIPGVGRQPLPAFRGEGSYVFISYAHKDSNIVFPEIKRFQDIGYNVWYDEGIGAGNEWLRDVLEHLLASNLFVVFITNNSVASINVQKEIKFAISKKKNIIPIYLEDFDEIDMDIQLDYELSNIQGILKTTLDEDEYIFKFTEAFERFGFKPNELDSNELFEKIELKNPEELLIDDALKNKILYSDIDSQSLTKYLDEFFNNLNIYDDFHNSHNYKDILKSSIDVFLQNKSFYNAYDFYSIFFSIYQILPMDKSVSEEVYDILKIPNVILELIDEIIAHDVDGNNDTSDVKKIFIHSLNVFILGLALYSQNKNYREYFKGYVLRSPYDKYYKWRSDFSDEEFFYRWGIASLLHDIYLPFENNGKELNSPLYKKFDIILGKTNIIKDFNDLNEIYKGDYYFKERFAMNYPKTKFLDMFKPTDIMAHKISIDFPGIDLNQIVNNLNELLEIIDESEFEEHGFLSALLILDAYGYLIQNYAKDPSFFFYPIVDSATAIFLHNYYRYFLQNDPFNLQAIHPEQSPLTFLLILCDNILEFYKKSETVIDEKINVVQNLHFDNNKFEAEYMVNSFSYGFGFTNEFTLDNLLELSSLFVEGVSISLDLSNLIDRGQYLKSNDVLSNYSLQFIENMVRQIYQQYVDSITEEYEENCANGALNENIKEKYNSLKPFDELSPSLKVTYLRQAKSIPKKLELIGCEIVSTDDRRQAIMEFAHDDVITLARQEHQEWCQEKIDAGWTYGKVRNSSKLIHDCLVPWHDLPPEIQQFDIDPIRNIPNLVNSSGFKIVLSKMKLLAFELYQFSQSDDGTDAKLLFESLPYSIQEIYLKKTDLIVKSLSKLDYNVVDLYFSGETTTSFENDEMRYFAQNVHGEWCELIRSLGWRYGETYDGNLKTNPYLRTWDNLPLEYARMQINIFKNLAKFCKNVDLKIIKNNGEGI